MKGHSALGKAGQGTAGRADPMAENPIKPSLLLELVHGYGHSTASF